MKESRYWEEEGKRSCRICGGEEETWEHVWERCGKEKEEKDSWQERVGEILGEEGEGEWWMIEIDERRRERDEREEREVNENEWIRMNEEAEARNER